MRKKYLAALLVPVLAFFSFAIVSIYRKGSDTGFQIPLAYIHLMDTMDTYDYSYFSTAYNDEINYYDWENQKLTGDGAKKTGFGGDVSMLGADEYNAYLKSLIAADNGIDELPTVVIAVMDSGINLDHEIFAGRVMVAYGRSFAIGDNGDNLTDALGHGTHVSGIICDTTLPNVKILPIKIFDKDNEIDPNEVIPPALEYIVKLKNDGMNIVAVNMSLGTNPLTPSDTKVGLYYKGNYANYLNSQFASYQRYIDVLTDAKILPIVAVGNGKHSIGSGYPSLPSACDGALSVSAFNARDFINYDTNRDGLENGEEHWADIYNDTNRNGIQDGKEQWGTDRHPNTAPLMSRAGYSNYGAANPYNASLKGSSVDIAASGTSVWSARSSGVTELKWLSGTSQATPFVASVYAALYSDPTKDWSAESAGGYLTSVEKAMIENTMPIGSPENMERDFGSGCVSLTALTPSYSRVPITGAVPSGKAKITAETSGGGMIMWKDNNINTPIGEYILVGKTDNFSGIIWAGGGYTILSVKIDGTEIYKYEEGEDKLKDYKLTIPAADLAKADVNIFVQFSAFSADELRLPENTVSNVPLADDPINLNLIHMMWVVLCIAGVITVIVSLINSRKRNTQADMQVNGSDDDIRAIIKQMESRKYKGPVRADLDEEAERTMRETEEKEEEDGDAGRF